MDFREFFSVMQRCVAQVWSLLFQVIEGIITLASGILTWFFIPDFVDKNTFLTVKQTALVLKRIDEDRGDATPDELTSQKVRKHLLDWKLWAYGKRFGGNYAEAG